MGNHQHELLVRAFDYDLAAAIAAFVMLNIDRSYFPAEIHHAFWLYSGGADGAKTLLSTVAGSPDPLDAMAISRR